MGEGAGGRQGITVLASGPVRDTHTTCTCISRFTIITFRCYCLVLLVLLSLPADTHTGTRTCSTPDVKQPRTSCSAAAAACGGGSMRLNGCSSMQPLPPPPPAASAPLPSTCLFKERGRGHARIDTVGAAGRDGGSRWCLCPHVPLPSFLAGRTTSQRTRISNLKQPY